MKKQNNNGTNEAWFRGLGGYGRASYLDETNLENLYDEIREEYQ